MGRLDDLRKRGRRIIYGPPPAPPPPPPPKRYIWLDEAPEKPAGPGKKKKLTLPKSRKGFLILIVCVVVGLVVVNIGLKQAVAFSPPYDATVTSVVSVNATNGQATVTNTLDMTLDRSVSQLDLPLKGAEVDGTATGQGLVTPAQRTPGVQPSQLHTYSYAAQATAAAATDTAKLAATAAVVPSPDGDWDLRVGLGQSVSGHIVLTVTYTVLDAVRGGLSGPMLDIWPYVDPGAELGATRGVIFPDGVSSATSWLVVPGAQGVTGVSCQLGTFSGAWTNVFSLVGTSCLQAATTSAPRTPLAMPSAGVSVVGRIAAMHLVADLPSAVHTAKTGS